MLRKKIECSKASCWSPLSQIVQWKWAEQASWDEAFRDIPRKSAILKYRRGHWHAYFSFLYTCILKPEVPTWAIREIALEWREERTHVTRAVATILRFWVGTWEEAQQARAFLALPEDPSLIPSTHVRWLTRSPRACRHMWTPACGHTYK